MIALVLIPLLTFCNYFLENIQLQYIHCSSEKSPEWCILEARMLKMQILITPQNQKLFCTGSNNCPQHHHLKASEHLSDGSSESYIWVQQLAFLLGSFEREKKSAVKQHKMFTALYRSSNFETVFHTLQAFFSLRSPLCKHTFMILVSKYKVK